MLIIGPKYNKRNSSKTGGIVVLFEDWIEYCKKNDFSYQFFVIHIEYFELFIKLCQAQER